MSRRQMEFAMALNRGDHSPLVQGYLDPNPSIQYQFSNDIRKYMATVAPREGASSSWSTKPEIPSPEELLGIDDGSDDGAVDLYPNKIDGPWPSTKVYLQTHYELLREDAVAPLRDAVAYVRQDPRMGDSHILAIYEKVYIKGITLGNAGVAARITFSTKRAGKNIVWEYSKRLITGNMVALSPADDAFQSKCVPAIVAARPLEPLKGDVPEVDIYFGRPEDADFDTQQEWLMVEAKSGYFEAHRHTLMALQKMSTESFPLSEHICGLKRKIEAPAYLEQSPESNMSIIYPDNDGINQDSPPSPEGLDSSQSAALRQILTKKLAIVQGPPGTGKTYVSVVALRALLANMQAHDPPIIVSAQTNHALDQLLRHVSKFEPEYVRVGGRSNDLEIKKRTLFVLGRNAAIRSRTAGIGRSHMRSLREKLESMIAPFKSENSETPLPASLFFKLGLITQDQHDSLLKGAEGWVHGGDEADPISVWLGDDLVRFEVVYKAENFGFVEEEIDLEYEQLKELEAEQGVEDDDLECLRGDYYSLKEGFHGRRQHALSRQRSEESYLRSQDMWKIPTVARGAVYNFLQKRAKEIIRRNIRAILKQYDMAAKRLKAERWEKQCMILQNAKIVGMTTTGLSKYRALVSAIKPKVILIEEAAEVIEAPVTAACVDSLKHLILVGDHQQLQGHCALKDLEGEPFNLNVSMFERLVRNNVDFKRLRKQRRMNPEIRQLLTPIYSDLEDHPSVLGRPGIPGMGEISTYFFCHTWPESSDSLMSRYNENEAKMVVGFYQYLVMNGVDPKEITVLTFYNGQRKKILKSLKDSPLLEGQYLKVVTVDSYQGEENEIVLLSLVRSNEQGNIGFLEVENRVCVALSRARRGFYIFGDGESISVGSNLWFSVCKKMREHYKRIGYSLPLTCSTHKNIVMAQVPEIFWQLDGGCEKKCGQRMTCGHLCPLRCHGFDHSKVRCRHPCIRKLPCGHKCEEVCFETCRCVPCEEQSTYVVTESHPEPSSSFSRIVTSEEEHAAVVERYSGQANIRSSMAQTKRSAAENHSAFVERYQEFANGGVLRDDQRLAEEAHQRAMGTRALRQADTESFANLFGRHKISDGPATSHMSPTAIGPDTRLTSGPARATVTDVGYTTVAHGASGSPVRRKYTQVYTTGGHPQASNETNVNGTGGGFGAGGAGGVGGGNRFTGSNAFNLMDL